MNLKIRDFFFTYWYLAFLFGGAAGFGISFLRYPLAFAAGSFFLWLVFFFLLRAIRGRETKAIRKMLEEFSTSEIARAILESSETASSSLGILLKKSIEKNIEFENSALASEQEVNYSPALELTESVERLIREQERGLETFHSFKDFVREWSSNIEKAGRINKSLLQLNELIVNDSKKVAFDTDAAARSATDGIKAVGKEIKAMTEIKATIGSSAEVIQQLSLASEQIGDFLATITAIARKTNLLALNAGIEAARAGEHGQGFAVVASEIKTLAEASAKASGDVKHLVDDIRSKTASAISLISTTGKIEENVNVVYSAGDVFMNIVKSIRQAGALLSEISKALDDQRNDNELLVQLINKIYLAGDQVRVRFESVEGNLAEVQKLSQKMKITLENIKK